MTPTSAAAPEGIGLRAFNTLPDGQARELLLGCCHAGRWAAALAAGRPYPTLGALLARAGTELADGDVTEALAGHPRIGAAPAAGHSSRSRREQAGKGGAPATVLAGLAAGNQAYEYGVDQIEDFALSLARHFTETVPAVTSARVGVEAYAWDRVGADAGAGHDHAFVRRGQDVRTTAVTVGVTSCGPGAWVVSGISDLVVLKPAGSEFRGFFADRYTTLAETDDRILATSLVARWRYGEPAGDWAASYAGIRAIILDTFAGTHSRALQQTLQAMGTAVLTVHPEVAEIRFAAPNKHHFAAALAPFGLDNPGEVFCPADRPYGLIEATVIREDAPGPGLAWSAGLT